MTRTYAVLTPDGEIRSAKPGRFAGWNGGGKDRKIFGRLTCASGQRLMKPENRVYFRSYEDAVACGFRPCKKCRPEPGDRYVRRRGKWQLADEHP